MWSHIAAYTRWGFDGSMAMSTAPVVAVAPASTRSQVAPPSMDR